MFQEICIVFYTRGTHEGEACGNKLNVRSAVTVHGGVEHDKATNDYVEVLNECVKSQLKLEDKSVLSKHIQSKHRGEELFMTRP